MKKIAILLFTVAITFSCNSESKKEVEESSQEINMENLVEVSIPVQGMTCEGCENAVKKSVGSLAGVGDVTASHVDSVAVVKYDKSLVKVEDIKGKIQEAGYTVLN